MDGDEMYIEVENGLTTDAYVSSLDDIWPKGREAYNIGGSGMMNNPKCVWAMQTSQIDFRK